MPGHPGVVMGLERMRAVDTRVGVFVEGKVASGEISSCRQGLWRSTSGSGTEAPVLR